MIGTGDSQYEPHQLARVRAAGHRTLVLESANHSLGIQGDLARTLTILRETVEAVAEYLDRPRAMAARGEREDGTR